ncbi:OmpA family protein [Thomasclavelia cocleata]|uniref:OmpA family protein n=1 Tax=Thomasclavelia cocleata TaxID=69824 RepID=UPI002431691F|nr:OmpA family protein [Thomasclavelia cocleata]
MKKIITFFTVVTMLFVLTGCDSDTEKNVTKENVSIVVGANQNTYQHNFNYIKNDLIKVFKNGGEINIISCQGSPTLEKNISTKMLDDGIDSEKAEYEINKHTSRTIDILDKIVANNEQIDVINSIQMAANAIEENEGNKKIFMFISGISTAGELDMSNKVIDDIDIENTIAALENVDCLPNLKDIDVVCYSMGCVGDEQYLSSKGKKTIENLYKQLIKKCGAKSVKISKKLPSMKLYENVPKVNIVESKKMDNLVQINHNLIDLEGENIYKLNNVIFEAEKTILSNETVANEEINVLCEYLKKKKNINITLLGTTAKDGDIKDRIKLSTDRAQVVAEMMYGMGIEKSRISIIGLGFENDFHIDEYDENGNFIDAIAQNNRGCYFSNSDSSYIKGLLK